MADLCIIYASPRRKIVEALDEILSPQWSVWWDDKITEGDYRGEIERQLAQAKCIIPVWCRVSRSDEDVIDEAEFARKRKVPLVPVLIEDVDPPLGFGGRQRVDLIGWNGDPNHPAIELLKKRISSIAPPRPHLLPRPATFEAGSKAAPAPVFFHSVSSHETQLRPDAAVRALSVFGARTILVSAYDTAGRLRIHAGDSDTPHRHAVVGVGTAYSPEGDLHVLVRNSWGAGWGLNGHAWLSISYLEKRLLWIGSIGGVAANEAH
ncbi:toll/interleukin-1 receptor domain-containing protein [Magnetospirillum moscoviense]|uniref:TIR domain-containing protein n=1 Tax=Magnetospirillum moscoviense TaxID=1437059 RepID=A0A178MBN7_9PROT|nr:toll/interleukin-1 receptor domain-containing protein [Magnetospirillum moscoviense]OAN46172.1 hypothetical protein A6A05_16405 [Magnetospirillum moscoviense]